MNEQLLALWKRVRRKVDQLIIFALVVLLVVMWFFWWIEQRQPEPDRPPLTRVEIPPTPTELTEFMEETFEHPKTLTRAPEYQGLIEFNMFDQRSIERQTDLVARLNREYDKAQKAFLANNLTAAEQICRDIIKQQSTHLKAQQLLKMIEERRRAQKKTTGNP